MTKKPDDAAKIAGFVNILKTSNTSKDTPPSPAPVDDHSAGQLPTAPARKRKPLGKSQDPNYLQHGIYLRKETHKLVKRRLEDTEAGLDVSELIQSLLDKWLKSDD